MGKAPKSLRGNREDLATIVHAALRARVVRLPHAAAHGACLDGREDSLFKLTHALTLAHFRLLMLR